MLAAGLGHSCHVPRHEQSHARSPSVALTMVPSPMVSGRGLDMEPVVNACSQPHRALWLVASGQKEPQQRRKMFLAVSFPAGFQLEVTFLWQYSNSGLKDSASCALTRCREGLVGLIVASHGQSGARQAGSVPQAVGSSSPTRHHTKDQPHSRINHRQ